jgi:hypothetical protein
LLAHAEDLSDLNEANVCPQFDEESSGRSVEPIRESQLVE